MLYYDRLWIRTKPLKALDEYFFLFFNIRLRTNKTKWSARMPSIYNQSNGLKKSYAKAFLFLFCGSLLTACGSGSDTTRVTPPEEPKPTPPKPIQTLNINATMPMQVFNAEMTIQIVGETKPLYQNNNFANLDATVANLDYSQYLNKFVLVTLKGNDKTVMYDPILDKFVPFKGTMHQLALINTTTLNLYITPISEAIYQRTLVRSNQFDPAKADLKLITAQQYFKATSEVRTSTVDAFNLIEIIKPEFSNQHSITTIQFTTNLQTPYLNLFHGLGLMYSFKEKFPTTENTFLGLSDALGVDLKDGYLDGRTLRGEKTTFNALVDTPMNTNPLNNSLLQIGALQKTARDAFAMNLKASALHYATQIAFQNSVNPKGVQALNNFAYIPPTTPTDSDSRFRWNGAGDYRPAFGLKTVESCSNGLNPCRQGLNVDDLTTYVNDAEYLIGTHQLNQCTIRFYPSGDVSITRGDKIYRSSLNRDLSDNLQQQNNDPTHYILNVGASENRPAYFLQFEIKDMEILKARTGYNHDIYSSTLETPEMDCGS